MSKSFCNCFVVFFVRVIEIENLNRNRSFSEKEKKGVVFSKDYQVDLDCFQPLIHIHSSLDSEGGKDVDSDCFRPRLSTS